MFCIVDFGGPQSSVAIAHKNWLHGNSQCYWPNFWKNNGKLTKALKTGMVPDPDTWKLYDIHVVGNKYFSKCYIR